MMGSLNPARDPWPCFPPRTDIVTKHYDLCTFSFNGINASQLNLRKPVATIQRSRILYFYLGLFLPRSREVFIGASLNALPSAGFSVWRSPMRRSRLEEA